MNNNQEAIVDDLITENNHEYNTNYHEEMITELENVITSCIEGTIYNVLQDPYMTLGIKQALQNEDSKKDIEKRIGATIEEISEYLRENDPQLTDDDIIEQVIVNYLYREIIPVTKEQLNTPPTVVPMNNVPLLEKMINFKRAENPDMVLFDITMLQDMFALQSVIQYSTEESEEYLLITQPEVIKLIEDIQQLEGSHIVLRGIDANEIALSTVWRVEEDKLLALSTEDSLKLYGDIDNTIEDIRVGEDIPFN